MSASDDQDAKREAAIESKGYAAYESLSEPERVWFTVTRLLFCIRDGGLSSYFYNGYSEHVVDCMRSLEVLGATEMQRMVRRMNKIDWDRPPGLLSVLMALIRSWSGSDERETQRELEQAVWVEERLNEYVRENRLA